MHHHSMIWARCMVLEECLKGIGHCHLLSCTPVRFSMLVSIPPLLQILKILLQKLLEPLFPMKIFSPTVQMQAGKRRQDSQAAAWAGTSGRNGFTLVDPGFGKTAAGTFAGVDAENVWILNRSHAVGCTK